MSTLFLDCHGDDLALFAAFTLQRHPDAHVCVVYDSYIQTARGVEGCGVQERRDECLDAYSGLFEHDPFFLGLRDDTEYTVSDMCRVFDKNPGCPTVGVTDVYSPLHEPSGHTQHNLVSLTARAMYPTATHHHYLTYTRTMGKSRLNSHEVVPRSADEIQRKLRALACYKSQMQMDDRLGTAPWFYGYDFREYLVTEP